MTTSDLATEVVACAERTLAERSARMAYSMEMRVNPAWPRSDRSRHGGLLVRSGGALTKRMLGRVTRGITGGGVAEGIVEPPLRRFMADYGHVAFLTVDGRSWKGDPGSSVAKRTPDEDPSTGDVLWLLDALRGVTDATPETTENVRGWPCRKVAAKVDLGRASAATEAGLCPPTVQRFEELLALPLTVWIDGERVRRVRFEHADEPFGGTYTVELWDFGVATDDVDWSRLPKKP